MGKKKRNKVVTANLVDAIELPTTRKKNSNGFLICYDAVIAREGVMQYADYELPYAVAKLVNKRIISVYRSMDELTANMDSYEGLPMTDGHHFTPVTIKDKTVVAGIANNVEKTDKTVKGKLTVIDTNCIFDIEQKEKTELSLGYATELKIESGTHDGQPYDVIQTNIKPNHIALTRKGRCGPECAIADSNDTHDSCDCQTCINTRENESSKTISKPKKGNTKMADKNLIAMAVQGKVVHVADDSVKVMDELTVALADAEKEKDRLQGELDTVKAELKDTKNKYNPEAIAKMVDSAATVRSDVLRIASAVIKDDLSALDNKAIMLKVLAAKGRDVSERSDDYIQAAFDSIDVPAAAQERSAGTNGQTFAAGVQDGALSADGMTVMQGGKPVDLVEAARNNMMNNNRKRQQA